MKKLILTLLVSAVFVAVGQQANAFTGNVIMGSSNGKRNLQVKNKSGKTTLTFGKNWSVSAGSDAYSTTAGAVVKYTNFTYTTATGIITSPAASFTLWSFVSGGNTYTFDLVSPVTQNSNTSTFFQITGDGFGYINGLDKTAGTWSLTGNASGVAFQFVASSVDVLVPDGGSAVALLGIALAGIEAGRRLLLARRG